VALVGAGPGVADLITLRGVQRLQLAEVIFYDRLVDPDLLALANPKADCILVGKAPGHHSWTQAQINRALVQAANAGKRVLRLKCGDPGIFARGGEEATALAAAGLAYEIIPGVTAANACAAHAGLFLTERGVVDTLVLTTATGQDHGLAPDWTQYLHRGARIAIYMGIHTAPRISDEITKSTYAREIEATIVSKLGQPDARSLTCRGQDLAAVIKANDISNPAVIFLTLPKSAPLSTARQFKAYGAPVGPG
jgi:uroporphyrin-III C-methyltransferase/precorrin-2 dehydrogenase/sirohydrochlorin ferrochelatase